MTNIVSTSIEASLAVKVGDSPPKVTILPFVKKTGKGENRRVHYWKPKRTGKFWEDIAIGQMYATEALQFMVDNPQPDLLQNIATDMSRNEGCNSLEMQFWRTIRDFTLLGLTRVRGS